MENPLAAEWVARRLWGRESIRRTLSDAPEAARWSGVRFVEHHSIAAHQNGQFWDSSRILGLGESSTVRHEVLYLKIFRAHNRRGHTISRLLDLR